MERIGSTITADQWCELFHKEAILQGWTLWNADGFARIQRIDEPEEAAYNWGVWTIEDEENGVPCPIPLLEGDKEALDVVRKQSSAPGGNSMCTLAQLLHSRKYDAVVNVPNWLQSYPEETPCKN